MDFFKMTFVVHDLIPKALWNLACDFFGNQTLDHIFQLTVNIIGYFAEQ